MITSNDGRFYEDFQVGMVIQHTLGRTVSGTDNAWFTLLTANTNPIHFDAHYASQTEYGKPLVNSCFTLALVTGLSVADISQNAVNLGWEEIRIPAPVFEGDSIYARTEVLSKRDSRSHPNMGLLQVKTLGFKQDGTVVLEFRRTMLIYRKGNAPKRPVPTIKKSIADR